MKDQEEDTAFVVHVLLILLLFISVLLIIAGWRLVVCNC